MAYKEYKVLHVTEGGIGTIFLGASGIPIKRLETTLNKEAADGWTLVSSLSNRSGLCCSGNGKRSLLRWPADFQSGCAKIMKTQEAIQEAEERIRNLVRELPDEKRLLFFQQTEKDLKDPDTYAALNALFIAGLHHFYLGQWVRGSINLFIFVAGMVFLFAGQVAIGIGLLIAISLVELKALFAAQIVVQDYNNAVMERIYREVIKD